MSLGGADEVLCSIADHDIRDRSVLEGGCGLGGAAVTLVQRCGAASVTGFDVQSLLIETAHDRALGTSKVSRHSPAKR